VGRADWLSPGRACDLFHDGLDNDLADAGARQILASEFASLTVDLVVQPNRDRRKKLLVADMESTIIENEMLDELADFLGLREEVAEVTRQAMNGEIDFAAALAARVSLLKGMPVARLDDAARRIRITPGAAALVATMRANGAYTALVSGGFSIFAGAVRRTLAFDDVIANTLLVENGVLAGIVREPIVTSEGKLAALKRLAGERILPLSASLAVGDGANDLPMMAEAGTSIAYHAKPVVREGATYALDYGDLSGVLNLFPESGSSSFSGRGSGK